MMKRTVTLCLLLGALMGTLSIATPTPATAAETSLTHYFETVFSANGQEIWIEGWVHFTAIAPGGIFSPTDPYRVYANLVNVRAVNWTTQETYVGVGSESFRGLVGVGFDPVGTYRFVATRLLPPNPVKVLGLGLRFDDLLVSADGSMSVSSVTVQTIVTPDG